MDSARRPTGARARARGGCRWQARRRCPSDSRKGGALMAAQKPGRPRGRRKVKKNVPYGQAHVKTSFNNTIVSLTDREGNVIAWESAGGAGLKGSRTPTPLAP